MHDDFATLLREAQAGNEFATGKLLEQYRPFLLQIASDELNPRLKSKVGASDVVQQSMLEAGAALPDFAGNASSAFQAWLRRILLHNLANQNRYYRTDKRNVNREISLTETDSQLAKIENLLVDEFSKSDELVRLEELSIVSNVLKAMSEEYRLVIRLRHQENQSFSEIGKSIGRSADAARKLWARAIEALKIEIDERTSL